ncbi:MAG: PAS domain S-box protein [Chloroflexi bacterium]|nr:PAS domain S-box protein [Chloroflexota bacterium]
MAEPIDSLEDFIYDPDPDSPGTFYRWLYVALGLFVGVVFVGALARVWNKRLHRAVTQRTGELRAANQQLKAHEQQLIASEQQLRAANQQLQAHEQQLQASNQQLLASEQQLKGANQQLIASEQTLRQSEAHYRGLVNSIDGIVWECDARTFGFTFVSEQAEKILGYPVECWLAEPTFWKDHIHKDDRGWAPEFCMQATSDKRDHEFEYRMIGADNQIVWLRDIVRVVVENNEPVKLCGMMIDITERKQAEETLRRQQEEQQTILDSVPALIFYKDRENRFLRVNRALVEASGVPREVWEGGSAFDLFPNQAEDYWRDDKAVMESGQARRNIIEPMETPGGTRWYRTDKIPYRDAGGQIIGIIGFSADITEQKRLEEQLLSAREELEGKVERQMVRRNPYGLTFREFTVLHLVAAGRSDKEIATELVISPQTVHKHVANILAKMDAASRTEAATRALKEGLLE